ncbi:hypothetical protein [Billgrantia montanilacus]|uniref:Uncharacterized protein n=1 Tax=Billgrantia montanilacus TaxID=2282305 RepID=A0A368U5H6_9GAMM|nr:hypothetical protein [Halomonas montanilacus]RCV91707.1 hypothetical protein DU505_01165 [Halomonas montanilacus]
MSSETLPLSPRVQQLLEQGYVSIDQQRPEQDNCVDYDLLFMGQRISGHRTLSDLALEADQALNPIDAALLLGAGPGICSAFWRHYDPVLGAQESTATREPAWD